MILLGRRAAAWVYAVAGLLTPAVIVAGVVAGALPLVCLVALAPSVLLIRPLRWALSNPGEPVPIPALAANVIWNLATNTLLAAALFLAVLTSS
mgnify:CR=1 FL=1